MEVDSGHKDAKAGDDAQRYAICKDAMREVQTWYRMDLEENQSLRQLTLELVSSRPQKSSQVCNALVKALAQGMRMKTAAGGADPLDPRGAFINVGGTVWESRAELKARCQDILQRYNEDARLEEADDRFMRCVLQYHPRGKEKLLGCQGLAVGNHPFLHSRCFHVVRSNGREDFSFVRCVDNAPTEEILLQRRICDVICDITHLHLSFREQLAQIIEESFPSYRGKSASVDVHRNWANSILELCERMPELTEYLLSVLVRRMVEMDTTLQKLEGDESEKTKQVELLADILDAQMMKLFEFLQKYLAGKVGITENRLAGAMFKIFEKSILLTHQSRCVQFLWFYLVSLRPAWSEAFLSLLLRTAFAHDQAIPKRLVALAYLASFSARAKFLTKNYTFRTAQFVATLSRENLQAAEAHMASGDLKHPQVMLLLYAVQALCYILCFHAEGFAAPEPGAPAGHTALHRFMHESDPKVSAEAFAPVLESQCNTIGRINKQVAEQLCAALRGHCPALVADMEQRIRETADVSGAEFLRGDQAGLDVFFPFDPYRLRHSSMFITGIYREWNAEEGDEEIDMDANATEGFCQSVGLNARADVDEDGMLNVDFTDAQNAADRGFVPSIKPSPMFQPRGSVDMTDIMSPLCMPVSSTEEDDGFALPSAAVPLDDGPSPMLFNLLGSAAFQAGGAT